jgi:hypothetical protein
MTTWPRRPSLRTVFRPTTHPYRSCSRPNSSSQPDLQIGVLPTYGFCHIYTRTDFLCRDLADILTARASDFRNYFGQYAEITNAHQEPPVKALQPRPDMPAASLCHGPGTTLFPRFSILFAQVAKSCCCAMYEGLWTSVSDGANPYMKAPSKSDISSSEFISAGL